MVISSEHEAAIERALVRAQARGIAVRLLSTVRDGFDVSKWFEASSHSHPNARHHVALLYSAEGVEMSCDCEGAQRGLVCQHSAAVARVEGLVEGAYSVPDLAEVEPTPLPVTPRLTLATFRERAAEADAYWGGR